MASHARTCRLDCKHYHDRMGATARLEGGVDSNNRETETRCRTGRAEDGKGAQDNNNSTGSNYKG